MRSSTSILDKRTSAIFIKILQQMTLYELPSILQIQGKALSNCTTIPNSQLYVSAVRKRLLELGVSTLMRVELGICPLIYLIGIVESTFEKLPCFDKDSFASRNHRRKSKCIKRSRGRAARVHTKEQHCAKITATGSCIPETMVCSDISAKTIRLARQGHGSTQQSHHGAQTAKQDTRQPLQTFYTAAKEAQLILFYSLQLSFDILHGFDVHYNLITFIHKFRHL